jgi:RNA polymerase sigma-70 factor, ECF subfamily
MIATEFNTSMLFFINWTIEGEGGSAKAKLHIEARLSESEIELVRGLAARDESTLAKVLAEHQGRIYQLALKITGSTEDAEEVTQDTFLKLVDSIDKFEGRSSLGTWLYKLGMNMALMRRRKVTRRREQTWEDPLLAFDETGHHSNQIGRWRGSVLDIEREETKRVVREAIQELPEDYGSVLILADMEGRSRQEIADLMELSVPAVKSRLHRARLMLRARLAEDFEEGGAP